MKKIKPFLDHADPSDRTPGCADRRFCHQIVSLGIYVVEYGWVSEPAQDLDPIQTSGA